MLSPPQLAGIGPSTVGNLKEGRPASCDEFQQTFMAGTKLHGRVVVVGGYFLPTSVVT